ncbi:hypothetical protein BGX24_012712, partial [Mortierella sp. AD032]
IPYDTEGDLYHRYDRESDRQYDCLAMSLKSRLDLLRGLRRLRVVALEDMQVDIYKKDQKKWVVQHWPNAKVDITDPYTDRDDDSMLSGLESRSSYDELEYVDVYDSGFEDDGFGGVAMIHSY